NPDFKRNSNNVNMIFFEERYDLSDPNTWLMIQDLKFNYYHCLRWLMINSNIEIVRFFILSNLDNDIEYALQLACENGHLEIVRLLISLNSNIHADNESALRLASENGHLEIVRLLISLNSNIHADNESALLYATQNGHLEVVQL